MMAGDKVFERDPQTGGPVLQQSIAYHFENEKFVRFLYGAAESMGVAIRDDKVVDVTQDAGGIASLRLESGQTAEADLFVDCSGFASVLLGKALAEPFISFAPSLFNDRAVRKVAASTKPFLLQTYRRDMGGGNFVLMKDLSAPIHVQGRHWGAFRMGFRHV